MRVILIASHRDALMPMKLFFVVLYTCEELTYSRLHFLEIKSRPLEIYFKSGFGCGFSCSSVENGCTYFAKTFFYSIVQRSLIINLTISINFLNIFFHDPF